MSLRRAIRASILTPRSAGELSYFDDGLLICSADGSIDFVGDYGGVHSAPVSTLDLRGRLIVPGFVDVHVHYPQTRVIGSATGALLDWLTKTVFPEEQRFTDETYAAEVADEFVDHCFAVGTTTVSAFSTSDARATEIMFETLGRRGMRGLLGLTLMDQGCPPELCVPVEQAVAAMRKLCRRFHGFDRGRLGFAVTPRFALSCSRPLLEAAAQLASELGLMIQTHVAENPREGEETLRAHPYARDYLGVYEATGLLGPRTILAHAVHLTASEWDRLAASGAKVAHCPDSNLFLSSGRMRLGEARNRSVEVGLGSDVAAGRTFDLRRAMAHAYDTAKLVGSDVSAETLFEMATLGGARVLGLGDAVGSLEVGKQADFAVLRKPRGAQTQATALRAATFGGELAPVESTFVRGRRVWHSA